MIIQFGQLIFVFNIYFYDCYFPRDDFLPGKQMTQMVILSSYDHSIVYILWISDKKYFLFNTK